MFFTKYLFVSSYLIIIFILISNAATKQQNDANIVLGLRALSACQNATRNIFFLQNGVGIVTCRREIAKWLNEINKKVLEFNILAADFAWNMSMDPENPSLQGRGPKLDKTRSKWRRNICGLAKNLEFSLLDSYQRRQFEFLCRGATLEPEESETIGTVLNEMQTIYTASKICIPLLKNIETENITDNVVNHEIEIIAFLELVTKILYENNKNLDTNIFNLNVDPNYPLDENEGKYDIRIKNRFDQESGEGISNSAVYVASKMATGNYIWEGNPTKCFAGEPDLERLMARSKNEAVLKWTWLTWREKVGPPMKPVYREMVDVKNAAARRKGYSDLGEIWRMELETPNLENLVDQLYNEIMDLYTPLHAVARYFLRRYHGPDVVPEKGPIPAHLLGNMWGQNWEAVLDMILPQAKHADLNEIIRSTNWTTHDMLKRAEDFYTSMGLPPMTEKFWKYSYFGENKKENNSSEDTGPSKCHGTAANMFLPGDYRMIYCAGLSIEDFYVIHHEMGHIQYYMAYAPDLPVIFQDGANSAFQESIGDSIMYGVLTPQHLQRLGLIGDNLVYVYPVTNINSENDNSKTHNAEDYNKEFIVNKRQTNYNNFNLKRLRDDSQLSKKYKFEKEMYPLSDKTDMWNEHLFKFKNQMMNDKDDYFENKDRNQIFLKSILNLSKKNKIFNLINDGSVDSELKQLTYEDILEGDVMKRLTEPDDEKSVLDFDTILILRQALSRLPQIPFGYIMDKYRWDIFSGKIKYEDYNKGFWDYVTKYQGLGPPDGIERSEKYFDAGAKFHISDNTPYVRYFLSSFLQVQMYRGMCQWSLFSNASPNLKIPMPLHRCDIYGSKKAGNKLREMMSKGSSLHWSEALHILTGERIISSSAIHEYFLPLKNVLQNLIIKHNIPLGW